MNRFVIATLPRCGSYLACQLLEQYLLKKYPDNYLPSPFYEWFCKGTINRFKSAEIVYKAGQLDTLIKDKPNVVDFDSEIKNRLEVIESLVAEDKFSLVKLVYSVNPEKCNNYFSENSLFKKVYLVRDVRQQIASRIIADRTFNWHKVKDHSLGAKNSFSDEQTPRDIGVRAKKKEVNNYYRHYQKYLKQIEQKKKQYPNSVTILNTEDIFNDYSHLYRSLGLGDWEEYIQDFDFLKSESQKSKELLNLPEFNQWISELESQKLGIK